MCDERKFTCFFLESPPFFTNKQTNKKKELMTIGFINLSCCEKQYGGYLLSTTRAQHFTRLKIFTKACCFKSRLYLNRRNPVHCNVASYFTLILVFYLFIYFYLSFIGIRIFYFAILLYLSYILWVKFWVFCKVIKTEKKNFFFCFRVFDLKIQSNLKFFDSF